MKKPYPNARGQPCCVEASFTLIELLVVIGIIAILAALMLGIGTVVGQKKTIARAQAQMHKLQTAIEDYKSKMGFYPPSSVFTLADRTNMPVNRAARNALFYELTGTVSSGTGRYTNIYNETLTAADIQNTFGLGGFANSGSSRDEVWNFFRTVSPEELGNIGTTNRPVWIFALPADGPLAFRSAELTGRQRWLIPWCYDASSTNRINADSYDLWIDIVVGGKTNRVCNWSDAPLVL
ncbi:MAG: type II secretion system GspH family protein [Verrucomicrobiae bacterium]|nr:type II secretion system GspH family protein [Verrucomicrobiae bacterium]